MWRLQLSVTLACLWAMAAARSGQGCTLSSRQVTQLRGCTFPQPVSETRCSGTCGSTSQTWLDEDANMEFTNCSCCQAASSRQVTVEMNCPGHPYTMHATCDNNMTVWFDGIRQHNPLSELSDWKKTSTFSVPPCTRVVSIECEDYGRGIGAILASMDSGVVTDDSWDCSTVPTDNWQYAGFAPDGNWQSASIHGAHGTGPWGTRPSISSAAYWIWTSDSENHNRVYCRKVVMDENAVCSTDLEDPFLAATSLTATCDNEMKVYFDGSLASAPAVELEDWKKTSTFAVPAGTQTVTIECLDLHWYEGILASFDNGLVTDSSWDCVKVPLSAGTSPVAAFVIGPNGMDPWKNFAGIDATAQWIWTPTESDTWVKCSKNIAPQPAPYYPTTRVPFIYTVTESCDCRPCGDTPAYLPPWFLLTLTTGPRHYIHPPCC